MPFIRLSSPKDANWLPIVSGAVVVAVALVCVWLWRNEGLRPTLAAIGAFAASVAGPLPALLTPEVRGKWLFAVAIAILITAGTWLGANGLQEQLNAQDRQIDLLTDRLNRQVEFLSTVGRELPAGEQAPMFLLAGQRMRQMYRTRAETGLAGDRQFYSILDDARAIVGLDPDNGHGLYYAGEAYRHFHDWSNMRDMFVKYLDAAKQHAEANIGAAALCYQRPEGFCGERTAYIDFLMALDFVREANERKGPDARDALDTALSYDERSLEITAALPFGKFDPDGAIPSSCGLLDRIGAQFGGDNAKQNKVRAIRAKFPACG